MASRLCKKLFPVAVCLILVGGCISNLSPSFPGGITELPSRADGLENIEFTKVDQSWWNRPSDNSWVWAVTINGENVYKLNYGESVRFGLEPGQYSFGVRCKGRDLVHTVLDYEGSFVIREMTAEITNSAETVRFSMHPGCSIRRVPLRSAEGIENIEINGKRVQGLPNTTFITVNGEDYTEFKGFRVRFGLQAGNHTIGVRCRNNEGELHQEEVAVTVKDNAPLLKLFVGRGTDIESCYIYEAATPQNSMDNQP